MVFHILWQLHVLLQLRRCFDKDRGKAGRLKETKKSATVTGHLCLRRATYHVELDMTMECPCARVVGLEEDVHGAAVAGDDNRVAAVGVRSPERVRRVQLRVVGRYIGSDAHDLKLVAVKMDCGEGEGRHVSKEKRR